MPLTNDFKNTAIKLCEDPEYRIRLLIEALQCHIDGDDDLSESLFNDYLLATNK